MKDKRIENKKIPSADIQKALPSLYLQQMLGL